MTYPPIANRPASAAAETAAKASLPRKTGSHAVGKPLRKPYVSSSCSTENVVAAAPTAYNTAAANATSKNTVAKSNGGGMNTLMAQSTSKPITPTESQSPRSTRYSFHTKRPTIARGCATNSDIVG